MKHKRLVVLVLLLFLMGAASAGSLHALLAHPGEGPQPSTPSSCPDPDHDGNPCGPACACSCCPGHAPALTRACQPDPFVSSPPAALLCEFREALHPQDPLTGIDRPPRP